MPCPEPRTAPVAHARGTATARGRRATGMLAFGGIVLLAPLLSGCFPVATPGPTVTVTVTAAAPPPTVHVAPPTEAPAPPAPPAAPPAPIEPNDPAPTDGGPAVDLGARPGATGFPVSDADHNLVSYAVVPGDSFFDIAQRFNIAQQRLLRMNPEVTDLGESIYIGQVINLDWTKGGGG